jgi:hypothetical protein
VNELLVDDVRPQVGFVQPASASASMRIGHTFDFNAELNIPGGIGKLKDTVTGGGAGVLVQIPSVQHVMDEPVAVHVPE